MGRKSGLSVRVAGLTTLPCAARRPRLYDEAVRLAFKTKKRRINGEVTIVFITRAKMLKINRQYLGHDYDTDVITFPHESVPDVPSSEQAVGDIFISAWMARRQARELGHSIILEAATLAAHGALHLLGHDDAKPRAKARMFQIQERIVASLGLFAFLLFSAPALQAAPRLAVEARAIKPGEILLVTVEGNDPKTPPEASLRGQALQFFPAASTGAWLAFAGLDLAASTGPAQLSARMRAPGGEAVRKEETLTVESASFPVTLLRVEQKFVTSDKNDAERAEGEADKLHKLFTKGEEKRLFDGRFDSPIPGAATARFGECRVFNDQPRAAHSGMDLKAARGRPVKAPAAGRVVLADPLFYQGKTIMLDHGLGLTTLYAHLSKILVKPGDFVKKGQVIGKVGATGRATGPHLHWALKFKNARVDPYSLVFLDLDAKLKLRPNDPLKRSPACAATERYRNDLPPASKWGKPSGGLRARAHALKAVYAPGEDVSLLIEIQNSGKTNRFLDFVREAALRPWVLGVGQALRPYETLASSRIVSGPLTEQVNIPPHAILCFEQALSAEGPLLARETTSWALTYGTDFLYASTAAVRAGLWRGRLVLPPAAVVVSTPPSTP